jgi:XTP/dITP diphosphohydrolase
MDTPSEILVASSNQGKLREIREICAGLPLRFSSLADYWDTPPVIPEDGLTFAENAAAKARWVFERRHIWTLADDSGLEVDALDGAPGVRSARFAGDNASDSANLAKLLASLAAVPEINRTARFRCVMCLIGPGHSEYSTAGVCEGRIIGVPTGSGGFGYDPVFVPTGFSKTFAELDANEKNAISHRGAALQAMKKRLHALVRH